ncbi:MAG: dTMP kinase [Bdellovibrionota bacterium]
MLHPSPSSHHTQFLTIEGGEGVGKSFLSNGLKARLEVLGHRVKLTREPGGTPLADSIRQLFLNPPEKPNAIAELFLVSAARAQHVESLIEPSLRAGQWVICDRFYDSTRVYQGDLGKVPGETLESVIAHSVQGCHPSLTFVLDCPADIARKRVFSRAKELYSEAGNRYDEGPSEMYEALRQAFLKRAREFPERIVIIDASQSPEHVLDAAWSQLAKRLTVTAKA